jgi:probable HAF family extracellular repeat protein
VNSSGFAAGFAFSADLLTYRAFLFDGTQSDLIPALGGSSNQANGMNDAGIVAGASEILPGSSEQHAFRYDSVTGELTDIGLLIPSESSSALAINDAGEIAGFYTISGADYAFLVDGSGFTDLGVADGYVSSRATAIAGNGGIAGFQTTAAGARMAFRHNPGPAALVDLGHLGGGESAAFGINSAGWIVGWSTLADFSQAAFLFDGTSMLDLNALIDSSGAGWLLTDALAINRAGQIAGAGYYEGLPRAFVLTPVPEPSTAGFLCLGAVLIAASRLALTVLKQWRSS